LKLNWKHPFKNITYKESINNDKFKDNLAIENGFKILRIWSDTPVKENIEICKKFIENEIK
jgi:very-short-patch-repair endonuclease